MKCIKHGEEVKRVKNGVAAQMVKQGWSYCAKAEWKDRGRKYA